MPFKHDKGKFDLKCSLNLKLPIYCFSLSYMLLRSQDLCTETIVPFYLKDFSVFAYL